MDALGKVFLLPSGEKHPPPSGATGSTAWRDDCWWEEQAISAESASLSNLNLGLKLSTGLIAIDIDSASTGHAEDGFRSLRERSVEMPSTLGVTRHESISKGVTLIYSLSTKGADDFIASLPGTFEGIDRISSALRYLVIPPSIVRDASYKWVISDAREASSLPSWVAEMDLSDLRGLVSEISKKELLRIFGISEDVFTEIKREDINTYLYFDNSRVCPLLRKVVSEGETLLKGATEGARHKTVVKATWAAVRVLSAGHKGGLTAFKALEAVMPAGRESEALSAWISAAKKNSRTSETCECMKTVYKPGASIKAAPRLRRIN